MVKRYDMFSGDDVTDGQTDRRTEWPQRTELPWHCVLIHYITLLASSQRSFGLNGSALAWFTSYLCQRQQIVSHRGEHSATTTIQFGVPQGSVLGPTLFVLYTADVMHLVEQYGFRAHQYTCLLYTSPSPRD